MLNFRSNFFFLQFAVFFFFIVIFGFWSIDLNSEEIYIAFSFFVMLVLGFVFFRANLMLLFTRFLNGKYSALLGSLLKIRRLGKFQSIDFRLQLIKRLNFLNSRFYVSLTSTLWSKRYSLFLRMTNLLWVKRALLLTLLGNSAFFFTTPTLRFGGFNFKSNNLFKLSLI